MLPTLAHVPDSFRNFTARLLQLNPNLPPCLNQKVTYFFPKSELYFSKSCNNDARCGDEGRAGGLQLRPHSYPDHPTTYAPRNPPVFVSKFLLLWLDLFGGFWWLWVADLKEVAAMIEAGAYAKEVRRIVRAVRVTMGLRRKLNASVLSAFLEFAV